MRAVDAPRMVGDNTRLRDAHRLGAASSRLARTLADVLAAARVAVAADHRLSTSGAPEPGATKRGA